jgi:hypothetical protein
MNIAVRFKDKSTTKSRNPFAIQSKKKKAGQIKDKRTPRGGSKNKQKEYQKIIEEEKS